MCTLSTLPLFPLSLGQILITITPWILLSLRPWWPPCCQIQCSVLSLHHIDVLAALTVSDRSLSWNALFIWLPEDSLLSCLPWPGLLLWLLLHLAVFPISSTGVLQDSELSSSYPHAFCNVVQLQSFTNKLQAGNSQIYISSPDFTSEFWNHIPRWLLKAVTGISVRHL